MNRPNDGFVLVCVLWVVALITIIALSYNYRARLEVQAARYSLDSSQARMAAQAGIERGLLQLRNKSRIATLSRPLDAPPQPPATHLGQPWAHSVDLFGPDGTLNQGPDFAEDKVEVTIEDLDRYINLNEVSEDLLAGLPGISRPLARRINYRRLGAEDGITPAQPFQHPDELRYLDEIDEKDWFGDDETPGLRALLTTYGDKLVNINTAPVAVLASLPEVDPAIAEDIVTLRNGVDGVSNTADDIGFHDWAQFSEATGIRGDVLLSLEEHCKFNSRFFRITSLATRRGGKIQSQCAVVVEVPIGADVAGILSWSEETLGAP